MKKCSNAGCDRSARAAGQCLMHYKQGLRHAAKVVRGQAGFSLPSWVKDSDVGYAAGYIDADGTITLATTRSESCRHGISFYPHVSAVSIDAESVIFLQEIFGGKIATRSRGAGNLRSTFPIHQWYAGGERASWICGVIAPYLKIKREQAGAVQKFYSERLWKQGPSQNAMPESEFQRRQSLVRLVKSRNRREYLQKIAELDPNEQVIIEIV